MLNEEKIRERLAAVNYDIAQIERLNTKNPDEQIAAIRQLMSAKDSLEWVLHDCDNIGCVGYNNGTCTKGKPCGGKEEKKENNMYLVVFDGYIKGEPISGNAAGNFHDYDLKSKEGIRKLEKDIKAEYGAMSVVITNIIPLKG